jgi:hypothetical protein
MVAENRCAEKKRAHLPPQHGFSSERENRRDVFRVADLPQRREERIDGRHLTEKRGSLTHNIFVDRARGGSTRFGDHTNTESEVVGRMGRRLGTDVCQLTGDNQVLDPGKAKNVGQVGVGKRAERTFSHKDHFPVNRLKLVDDLVSPRTGRKDTS